MMVEMVVVIRQGTSPQYQNRYLDLVQTNHLQIVRRQCCLVVIMILVEMMKLLLITCVRTLSSHCRGPFKWSSEVEHCETKWQCSVAIGNIAIGDKRSQKVTYPAGSRGDRLSTVLGTPPLVVHQHEVEDQGDCHHDLDEEEGDDDDDDNVDLTLTKDMRMVHIRVRL